MSISDSLRLIVLFSPLLLEKSYAEAPAYSRENRRQKTDRIIILAQSNEKIRYFEPHVGVFGEHVISLSFKNVIEPASR
jgi:hypothetical protein